MLVLAGACSIGASAAERSEFDVETMAAGVYVHHGAQEAVTPANRGDVGNAGFVVGERCVAVIDTGGSLAVGRALRDAIRAVTDRRVCYVINTHAHPDHVFGNAAFAEDRPEFIGHVRLADAMRRRGPNYLAALLRDTNGAASGSSLVLPTRSIADSERLDLGGRTLVLRAWRTAHTDADLTVLDEASGTLFLGDLGFVGHMPVVDGSVRGYLAVLEELKSMRAARAVAGHGRAKSWPAALEPQERYLRTLVADVRAALKSGKTLSQTVASIGFDRGEGWLLGDLFHQRNVTAVYAELEWE